MEGDWQPKFAERQRHEIDTLRAQLAAYQKALETARMALEEIAGFSSISLTTLQTAREALAAIEACIQPEGVNHEQ